MIWGGRVVEGVDFGGGVEGAVGGGWKGQEGLGMDSDDHGRW